MSTTDSQSFFQLFTSLRYDPLLLQSTENSLPILNYVSPSPFYMLVYHRDRMLEAAQHFDFQSVAERLEDGKALHEELLKRVGEHLRHEGKDVPLKVSSICRTVTNMNAMDSLMTVL